MSRRDADRLDDIEDAILVIRKHLARGGFADGLVFDAVRIRLLEIGEAVKAIPPQLLETESSVDWPAIARFRDQLAHHSWDTAHAILQHVVDVELEEVLGAVQRLRPRADAF